MDRTPVINALRDSIAHWERMRDLTHAEGESCYDDSCALCGLFDSSKCETEEFGRCPLLEHTSSYMCDHYTYIDARSEFLDHLRGKTKNTCDRQYMIDTLQELLDKELKR